MAYKKGLKKPYIRRPKRMTKRKVAKKVTKPIKTYVKRAINSAIETKMVTKEGTASLFAYTGTSWSSACGFRVTPSNLGSTGVVISQGDAQDQRTGNVIKTHKCLFKGVIYPNGYDVATNPIPRAQEIVFWFISFRPQPSISTNPVDGTFFQQGGSAIAPSGSLIDTVRSINKERFIVYGKKVMKLGFQSYNGTGQSAGYGNYANNDFKLNCRFSFDLTKHVPKKVLFNDALNNDPTTRALWVVWEAVNSDGTTQGIANVPATMQYQIDYYYKDG